MDDQQTPGNFLFTQGCVNPTGVAFPWATLYHPILGFYFLAGAADG